MQLHSTLLPKLSVSIKLLICLLMVVTCEGYPSLVRSVRLYNQCSCSMLRVNRTGAVLADNSEDGYEVLTMQSRDYTGNLIIYGDKSKRYLCFNKNWKLIGRRKLRGRCLFTEEMTSTGYYRFRSSEDKTRYLGFAASGRQLRWKKPAKEACYNFVKLDPEFSIKEHNELMAGPPRVSYEAINKQMTSQKHPRRHRHGQLRRNKLS